MRDDAARTRFSATIGRGGTIRIPAEARALFGPGRAVEVSLVPRRHAHRGIVIDEREVAWIAALQAEPAQAIRKCLEAQGAFAGRRAPQPAGGRAGRTPRRGKRRR